MSGRPRSRQRSGGADNDERRERPAIPERPVPSPSAGAAQRAPVAVSYPSLDGPPAPAAPPPRNSARMNQPYYPPVDYPPPSSSSSRAYYPHGAPPPPHHHPADPYYSSRPPMPPPPRDYWGPPPPGAHYHARPPGPPFDDEYHRHYGQYSSSSRDPYARGPPPPHHYYEHRPPPPYYPNGPPPSRSPPYSGPSSSSRQRPESPPPRDHRDRTRSSHHSNTGSSRRRDRSPRGGNSRPSQKQRRNRSRSPNNDSSRRRRQVSRTPLSSSDHSDTESKSTADQDKRKKKSASEDRERRRSSPASETDDSSRKRSLPEDVLARKADDDTAAKRRRLSIDEPPQNGGLQANRTNKLAFGINKPATAGAPAAHGKKPALRSVLGGDEDNEEPVKPASKKAIPEEFTVVYPTLDSAREPLIPKAPPATDAAPVEQQSKKSSSAIPPPPSSSSSSMATPAPAAAAEKTDTAVPTAIPKVKQPNPTELYERLVQVGEGTYGKVYKARNVETSTIVGLKKIRMEAEKDGFPVTSIREIKLLQSVTHSNVIQLIEMMVSRGSVYMVFEYMEHDLTGVLNHPSIVFTQAHLKSLMQQFLEGLGFVHQRGILHRDLKGSNILLSRTGELKIADFGLARFFAKNRRNDYTNRVITQWYKPPELLFGATVYGAEVDTWSAGCIFLELFARRPVFQGQDEIHQLDVIFDVTGTPTADNWPAARDLPWYDLVKPKHARPSRLRELYSTVSSSHHRSSAATTKNGGSSAHAYELSPATLDLAERLLSLDPSRRASAQEALSMPYFVSEEPAPQVPSDVLAGVKGEWHEYESKKARRKLQKDDQLLQKQQQQQKEKEKQSVG